MAEEYPIRLTVADLIEALKALPQDAVVIGEECGPGVKVVPQNTGRVLIASTRADFITSQKAA